MPCEVHRRLIEIPAEIRDEMVAHAVAGPPGETCGFLAGLDGRVLALYPVRNEEEEQPRVRYTMHAEDRLRAESEIEDKGWAVTAIYHSHPLGPNHPSATDIKRAFWRNPGVDEVVALYPDTLYVIVSLMDRGNPEVRAFHLTQDDFQEEDVMVS